MEHCYNKGCGKQFKVSDNSSTSCTFHPGEPYFHDAYKEWTCCKKRSTDFTEFLNFKGCKTSFHSHVKPVEKPKPKPVEVVDEISKPPAKPQEPMQRPDASSPLIPLPVQVTASLKKSLEEQLEKLKLLADGDKSENNAVKVGDPCQHRGCAVKYDGPQSDHSKCIYHPGFPVFHEGMKYWTCCQRKTSEFDVFMKQEGCEQGNHVWKKTAAELQAVPTCRTDWHQTPSHVYATFYAKNAVPEQCSIQANPVKLKVKLVFDAGKSLFEKEMVLGGIIDIEQSDVTLAGPKVEVKMKKAEAAAWKTLDIKEN
ncbi:cysteine and histidine-rich domain-containing protein 1-like [Paramacrobiotus metropolitanus]|uniref:cysteine and histidine-rich domain-containing protein 1-like n=1 Tax=Paramacrobiotus metropolitanus TaxID=2943436 RepID=UPI0024461333|nr:cysteine and histidine-rich domain-containing protein 1-like [Paramacrobiotus metropolitanus]